MLTSLLLTGVAIGALLQVTSAPSTQPTSPELRVTCFNVRLNTSNDGPNAWPLRKEAALGAIRNADPDILGVQELLDSMRVDLVAALPAYTFIGVGRDDGKTRGEYSALLLKRDRFDIVESGTFWLSPTPDVPGSVGWDAALTRVCTWAIVRDRKDANRTFAILNAHFDHQGGEARTQSAKLMLDKVNALGLPAIVMGDFNSFENTAAYKTLAAPDAKLVDTFRSLNPTPTKNEATFHGFSGNAVGQRIDYIFVRGFGVASANIDREKVADRWPSDHYPIHAVVRAE